jgi:hypothetical protein
VLKSEREAIKSKPNRWIKERWNYYMTKDDAIILGKEATRRLIELENRLIQGEIANTKLLIEGASIAGDKEAVDELRKDLMELEKKLNAN